jgi:hypothetical protein
MMTSYDETAPVVYWHRQLPPLRAEAVDEHTIEANSIRVPWTVADHDELWDRCRVDLAARVSYRVEQEVARLGGRFAHVLGERIDTKRDQVTGDVWLSGRYTYMLYR